MIETNSEVKVTPIQMGLDGKFVWKLDLGDRSREGLSFQIRIQTLLIRFSGRAKQAFLLEWEGSRYPNGAVIDGVTIVYCERGSLMDEDGTHVAVYERVLDSGGPQHNRQKMLALKW